MSGEHQTIEKKSLSLVVGKKADFHEIAKECVGMANARGGHIFIEKLDTSARTAGQSIFGKNQNKLWSNKPNLFRQFCLEKVVFQLSAGKVAA